MINFFVNIVLLVLFIDELFVQIVVYYNQPFYGDDLLYFMSFLVYFILCMVYLRINSRRGRVV